MNLFIDNNNLKKLTIGNIASDYNEVGRYADEDKCCREHDLCPSVLGPGECKRGLCNSQSFTRSHCDCDAKFRRCLQGLNTGNNKFICKLYACYLMHILYAFIGNSN